MEIAILLYDQFTALDAVGPYEVLHNVPGATVTFVAEDLGPIRSDSRVLALTADATLDDRPTPDVLVVPGGSSRSGVAENEVVLDWIRGAHETSTWTTSVCTGSLILAAAGLLTGRRAT